MWTKAIAASSLSDLVTALDACDRVYLSFPPELSDRRLLNLDGVSVACRCKVSKKNKKLGEYNPTPIPIAICSDFILKIRVV